MYSARTVSIFLRYLGKQYFCSVIRAAINERISGSDNYSLSIVGEDGRYLCIPNGYFVEFSVISNILYLSKV